MLTSGDVIDLDLGQPAGQEAGFSALVVTAQRILNAGPNVVQIVPLTSSIRDFGSEVVVEAATTNGLDRDSSAQGQHIRAVSIGRVERVRGNVGSVVLAHIRGVIGLIIDIPS